MTGTVRDNLGVPVVGAQVTALTTPARPSDRVGVESVHTNRQGVYSFTELEKVQGENQFKISVQSYAQGDDKAFGLFGSWYGGGQDYERAPVVTVTPGTPVGAVDVVLERAGGIAGSVTGLPGTPLEPSVTVLGKSDGVEHIGVHGGFFDEAVVDFESDSTFESRSLRPGTYKVRFDDDSGFHAGEWWKDKSAIDDAVVITVKSGQLVSGLDAVLGNRLVGPRPPVDRRRLPLGRQADHRRARAAWNVQTDTDFAYEWLVGDTVVGTGDVFTPTSAQSATD